MSRVREVAQMTNCYVFNLPNDSTDMIHTFNLKPILSNERTSIYQNEFARFSIDKKVVRVLVYSKEDYSLLQKIRNYFYGEHYAEIQ